LRDAITSIGQHVHNTEGFLIAEVVTVDKVLKEELQAKTIGFL
jgi:hypothetical protein